jgi:glycosyltransferase involved in cell wall biosynthesis
MSEGRTVDSRDGTRVGLVARDAMRVAIDARAAAAATRTGVGSYTRELVRRLPVVDPHSTYVAWRFEDAAAGSEPAEPPASNLIDRPTPAPAEWLKGLVLRLGVPRIEWLVRFDLLFAPNFVPPPTRRPFVVTVHDLAFRLFPETAAPATHRWLERLDAAVRRARAVIVPSEQTRRDLAQAYPGADGRVTVIPLAVDAEVYRPSSPAAVASARARLGIDGPYLLSLTGIEPRKNLETTIRAFAAIPDDVRPRLVMAGPVAPWNPGAWDRIRPVLDGLPSDVRDRVVIPGFVSETDKVALLTDAAALVYPSLYEGFGLPVLEAMACGVPVLTSNVSALPETAGDAALLVDPLDVDEVAHGMARLLTDETLRERLRSAGRARARVFDWNDTARRTAEVLHEAAGGRSGA